MEQQFYVDGFVFASLEEANKAVEEANRIEAIQEKLDLNNDAALKALYFKAIDQRVFETQVGLEFLRNIQLRLFEKGLLDIAANPLILNNFRTKVIETVESDSDSLAAEKQEEYEVQVLKLQEKFEHKLSESQEKLEKYKTKDKTKNIICFVLTGVIVILFIITFTGKNANIINYKHAIANEYSEWEQQLNDREEKIREKEKELNISTETTNSENVEISN